MMEYVEELQKFNNTNNNLNKNEINQVKNHQQLVFPSHLYKRLFENVVSNKDIQTENIIDQSAIITQTAKTPKTSVKNNCSNNINNKIARFDETYIRKKFLKEVNSNNYNNSNDTNYNNEKSSPHWNLTTETTNPSLTNEENNNNNNNLEAKSEEETTTTTVITSTTLSAATTSTTTLPQQGLVHWMNAVMAEHMTVTSGSHHHHHLHAHLPHHHTLHHSLHTHPDPAVGMNYAMWNTIDGKLNAGEHQQMINQNHKDEVNSSHIGQQQPSAASLYAAAAAAAAAAAVSMRSTTSGNSSPVHGLAGPQIPQQPPPSSNAHLLVVPHPINSNKINYTNRPANTGRKFKCKMCPQIFNSKADHQHHSQAHMRETKPYKCSQCSKTFANSSYLSQHTRIHLGIKPYRCEICQRKFTQLSHLQQHIRTHTGDKPYKCRHPGCQKAFSQLSNLQSHSRCHQTDKPYKCNSCYKCFTDETSLLEHIPKHKESKHLKTHICQYCGKSYTQETYLSKHMQKHAERPDKRPAIAATLASLKGNLAMSNAPLSVSANDHPYWPKVSPDSAATIAEAMQQQQQNQYDFAIGQHSAGISGATSEQLQSAHHRVLMEHHRNLNGNDDGEDLVVTRQNVSNLAQHLIVSGHNPPSSTANASSSGSGNYDSASVTKTTANSAFTPINTMVAPHLNTIGHHQLTQRPYLYDAISFQNKNVNQNSSNAFQNQLISLHQIRNYQPGAPGGLMTTEHVLGIGVGSGKDKGQ